MNRSALAQRVIEWAREDIAAQASALQDIRARSNVLASAMTITALAGSIVAGGSWSSATTMMGRAGLALVLLGLAAAVAGTVWAARPVEGQWRLDPARVLRDFVYSSEPSVASPDYVGLAEFLASHLNVNQRTLDRLMTRSQLAFVGLGLGVLGLLLAALDRAT